MMPVPILSKEALIPGRTSRLVLHAPHIAARALPGNFVILRLDERGERIPLTIADTDPEAGTVTIVYLVMGKTTAALEQLSTGGSILDLCGPLGRPTHIVKTGTVVCLGGGTGIAAMHHIAKGHHRAGNHVISVIGARSRDLLLYHSELSAFCPEVAVSTDDGSFGRKGIVTDLLRELLQQRDDVREVIAVGPVPMMEAVVETVRPFGVPTTVSLNSIMVDGIGMCGACRVSVGGTTKFTCVDGPEFDGFQVDFAELRRRLAAFKDMEKLSYDRYCTCLGDTPPKKEKPRSIRVPMPCRPAAERVKDFGEVAQGYSPGLAAQEAGRCLQCKKPACVAGCPVEVPIPQFIKAVADGRPAEAYELIKRANSLPAVCGRVCPQESQCEGRCILNAKGNPIAVGRLERYAADAWLASSACRELLRGGQREFAEDALKVACIGSGPASLTAAGYLAGRGVAVTVFEALHEPGGVLVYGIPEFRLPKKDVVAVELDVLKRAGVRFLTNQVGGRSFTVAGLFEQGFRAVFIGVGAGLPSFLNVPGENLIGVFSANEYLTRANLGRAYAFPNYDTPPFNGRQVTVFGGGNVAMDAARTALRMGAEKVDIVYRRTTAELPARHEEVEHAVEEGVAFTMLSAPLRFLGDAGGRLEAVELQRMQLGDPDASGRRSPVPVAGDIFTLRTDLAIIAVGTGANPVLTESVPGLKLNRRGYIETDANGETSIPDVFAGGDIVSGAATVILAMGAGLSAAKVIAGRLGV
jgi:glutamate synthase (NADPH/NADH) small chain